MRKRLSGLVSNFSLWRVYEAMTCEGFESGGCRLVFQVGRLVGNLNHLRKRPYRLHSLCGQP